MSQKEDQKPRGGGPFDSPAVESTTETSKKPAEVRGSVHHTRATGGGGYPAKEREKSKERTDKDEIRYKNLKGLGGRQGRLKIRKTK